MCWVRILFLYVAFSNFAHSIQVLLNEEKVARWLAAGEPLFGPNALPFNLSLLLIVAIGYVFASLSRETFRPETRLRVAGFLLLHAFAIHSIGTLYYSSLVILAFFYLLGCRDEDLLRSPSNGADSLTTVQRSTWWRWGKARRRPRVGD